MPFYDLLMRMGVLTIILSAVPLLACALVGLLVAVVQAATQIQEQSIQYIVKLAVFVVLAVFGSGWALEECLELFRSSFALIISLGA